MFAWVAVFVLPLNAAINPVLYTISTLPIISSRRKCLQTATHTLTNGSVEVMRLNRIVHNVRQAKPKSVQIVTEETKFDNET